MAKDQLSLDLEIEKMSGIIHDMKSISDLDEAPGAYKDIKSVMNDQADCVAISHELKPLAVIKG